MKHRDLVIYVRNGVEINALVATTQDVFTPATQEREAFTTEHLTLVYLDPSSEAARLTGDQLRASIKTAFDVPPMVEGAVNGWKPTENDAIADDLIAQYRDRVQELEAKLAGTPSAADLDAVAAEDAKQATNSPEVVEAVDLPAGEHIFSAGQEAAIEEGQQDTEAAKTE